MLLRTRLLFGSSLLAGSLAASAGTAEVSFIDPTNYWDAGNTSWDEPANLRELGRHLQKLAQRRLPADQVLKVEVLQVDLAGTVRAFHGPSPMRVITGGADLPKIQLRYWLSSGDRQISSGEEWVTDLTYTMGLSNRGDSSSLFYEKRMLDGWFNKRFVAVTPSPG